MCFDGCVGVVLDLLCSCVTQFSRRLHKFQGIVCVNSARFGARLQAVPPALRVLGYGDKVLESKLSKEGMWSKVEVLGFKKDQGLW